MDCFASLAPTGGHTFAFSRRISPEVCISFALFEFRGRREDRVLAAPEVSCAVCAWQEVHTSIQGSGSIPAFPAQWLYGLLRALPAERLFCLRYPKEAFASSERNASTATSEPHDFAVRFRRLRL